MTTQITCLPSPSLRVSDCTLATLTIVLQALPILILLTLHSSPARITFMYVALNTLHDHHSTTNLSHPKPPGYRRSPAAAYFFQHSTYCKVQGCKVSGTHIKVHISLNIQYRRFDTPHCLHIRRPTVQQEDGVSGKHRVLGVRGDKLAERVTTCNVATQNVDRHLTFCDTRGLRYTEPC
jgi:hypothetical protein